MSVKLGETCKLLTVFLALSPLYDQGKLTFENKIRFWYKSYNPIDFLNIPIFTDSKYGQM